MKTRFFNLIFNSIVTYITLTEIIKYQEDYISITTILTTNNIYNTFKFTFTTYHLLKQTDFKLITLLNTSKKYRDYQVQLNILEYIQEYW